MLAEVIVDYLRSTAYYQLRAADDAGAASFDEVDPAIWHRMQLPFSNCTPHLYTPKTRSHETDQTNQSTYVACVWHFSVLDTYQLVITDYMAGARGRRLAQELTKLPRCPTRLHVHA